MIDFFVLTGAAFSAGVLNAIAGGGTFLTLPALVYVGISPVAANATSTIVVCPDYIGATLGFLPELRTVDRDDLVRTVAASVAGALIDSCLLVVTSDNAFNVISIISLLAFAAAGIVAWPEGLLMMVAAVAGGYCGAPLSRALPTQVIRTIVIVTGITMSLTFFARLL